MYANFINKIPVWIILVLLLGCNSKHPADLLVHNASIYSVDSSFTVYEAMAIKDGKIIAMGKNASLLSDYDAKEIVDAEGKYIYPGFIDAHCHFLEYGLGLQTADLVGTESWEAIIDTLKSFASRHNEGWLIGRGWDQNDWPKKEFPTNQQLNELFPDRPVLLSRVDGHAAIANNKALELAGIKAGESLTGGEIEVKNGRLTGILIDNAVNQVYANMPSPSQSQLKAALLDAQANCFSMGLTTVDDCGLDYPQVLFMDSLQKTGELKMRVYAMLADARINYEFLLPKGKIKTDRMNVRSFKVYADGALGSRGACLLQPYSDKPGHLGFLLNNTNHYDSVAAVLMKNNYQMCTHAIGDSGNRTILKVYAKYLKGKNDLRWRIEHAQVVNPADFGLFGQNSIIPSVQPTHATSDMYWAGVRLGKEREKGAYAYQQLLKENGWIALGTDFPVEDISPFKTFYAAVVRKDAKGFPQEGYQMENALTRQQTLRGMTIWAAKSNFEEGEKGSLETGKLADFVILDKDLMKIPATELLSVKVIQNYLGGEKVFSR
ncbi:amidohydrolase [Flavihumibacter profundi]|uniref:amidohydrolase n=1 Tax=Flavihumibacter profundi TaxID=2716883 RepID=UPI001CC65A2B|nr:amidohydrolase [Flavihumibacter profundi]MBZ5856714.1 amidohydrolase [Flavihumibacter profundi]